MYQFDETKHPRDDDGKFTDKTGGKYFSNFGKKEYSPNKILGKQQVKDYFKERRKEVSPIYDERSNVVGKKEHNRKAISELLAFHQKYQNGKANRENFMHGTIAVFREAQKPNRPPDYESRSGSKYWYTPIGVFREADHWGDNISSCYWVLDEKNKDFYADSSWHYEGGEKVGFAKWKDFVADSTPITIHPQGNFSTKEFKEIIPTFENAFHQNKFIEIDGKTYFSI